MHNTENTDITYFIGCTEKRIFLAYVIPIYRILNFCLVKFKSNTRERDTLYCNNTQISFLLEIQSNDNIRKSLLKEELQLHNDTLIDLFNVNTS